MSVETYQGPRPPLPPKDADTFLDDLYRLRIRYANLPNEDRFSPPQESQKPQYQSVEMATGLLVFNSDLKEAGFDSEMEFRRLLRDINKSLVSGKNLSEAVRISAEELEVNLRSYDVEIIKQRPFLPHLNRFDVKNERLRMVGNNGEPVVDAITVQERNGAVVEASQAIENFLLSALNNSFAVLMNPVGWNGFVSENGEELSHLNAEIMIFWKDQSGSLKGGTLVVDLSEKQAREIMVSLGIPEQILGGKSEHERLVSIVRNPALLAFPRSDINLFEYVLDKILDVRGKGDFRLLQRDGTVEIRSVEEVRRDISRFDELLLLSQEEERLIAQPRQLILNEAERLGEKDIQQEIVYKIEEAIVRLTRKHLNDIRDVNGGVIYQQRRWVEPIVIRNPFSERDNFAQEIAYLKTRAGCPPGVASLGRVLAGISLGQNTAGAASLTFGGEVGKKDKICISCGEVNYCTKDCYKCGGMLI